LTYFFFFFFLLSYYQTPNNGKTWLQDATDKYNMNKDNSLRIPKSKNNGDLKLEQLNEDQFNVAYVIFDKVREWINLKSASSQVKKKFKPL